jgi:hypothetical protein
VKHHEQPYLAGLYVGDGVGTVGACLHLDDLPVAHRDDHLGNAVIERPFALERLLRPERHDDSLTVLDRLLDQARLTPSPAVAIQL